MDQDRLEGHWRMLKGTLREHWGRLIGDDLDVIAGQRDQLLGRIQQSHGAARASRARSQGVERTHPEARSKPADVPRHPR
jgi:uncharacterized protein YjbJ (UPF0337 family)